MSTAYPVPVLSTRAGIERFKVFHAESPSVAVFGIGRISALLPGTISITISIRLSRVGRQSPADNACGGCPRSWTSHVLSVM
eukprot:2991185-Rhodomonas_salina.1